MMEWYLLAGILLFFGGIVIVSRALDRRQAWALKAWALENGWSFTAELRGHPNAGIELFHRGSARRGRYYCTRAFPEAVPGWPGAAVLELFQYQYTSGSGDNRSTSYFLCVAVRLPMDLGRVVIRPEGWGDRFVAAFGFEDIDFEDPEFSRQFHVSAADRRDAYALLEGPMMSLMSARGQHGTVCTDGHALVVYTEGQASPERFDGIANYTRAMLTQIPRTLVNRARGRAGLSALTNAGAASRVSRSVRECL
ncbi:MAG: hypothetical protein AAFU77_03130 [Myxococcota bacterium]